MKCGRFKGSNYGDTRDVLAIVMARGTRNLDSRERELFQPNSA